MLRPWALLGVAAVAGATRILGRSAPSPPRSEATSFVRALDFSYSLRICNAYPFASPLEVIRGEHERLTGKDGPMPYETCRDFSVPLKVGDKLEFKIGEATTGTFAVSELPASDSVLLLVVHRHDPLSTAVSFESHVFSNMESPQVAIIDAYEGSAKGKAVISDAQVKGGPPARREELRYSSVVSVLAGEYTVELDGAKGPETASKSLVALPHENYVLLRTGIESRNGQSYPEDLVVFPNSQAKVVQRSAAAIARVPAVALLVAAVVL